MRRPTVVQVMSVAVAMAPLLALGAFILVPYLQRPSDEPKTLKEFIMRGVMEPPILHPGVAGTIVLAACALLAEAPVAVVILARTRRALKLAVMTALVGVVWLGCLVASTHPRSLDPEWVQKRFLELDLRPRWQIAAEPWVLETGPGILFVLLPIGVGGAWFLHTAKRVTSGRN